MAIDDLADRVHGADIVVDQTLGRQPGDYASQAPSATILAGSHYALLRPEFAHQRATALARRARLDAPHHLLVNLGGMDSANHTPRVLAMAVEHWQGPVTVVMGAQAPGLVDVRQAVQNTPGATLEIGSNDMAGLLSRADLAIGAAGTSAWERCALGLPALMLTCAENQRLIARSLDRAGAAIDLAEVDALQPADLGRGLAAVADPRVYRAMCRNAANVCDGYGALRVSMAMAAPRLENAPAGGLSLRPATGWDIAYLFYLQTRPGAREWSVDPRVPDWDQHRAWCRRRLASRDHGLYLIYDAADVVGMVRLDPQHNTDVEISIIIDPSRSGRGWATRAAQAAVDMAAAKRVIARIHPKNAASQRVFAKAGFRQQGEREGFQRWLIAP